jgi:putative ABC transport system ATP-binding protein
MPPIISFDHIFISIHGKPILSDINLAIAAGEKAVFRGRSGSGKSTALKALLGLYPLSGGNIFFREKPLCPATVREVRACAAYIGQEPVLGADTVREALRLPFRFKAHRGHEPTESELAETLARLHLSADILDRECARVSGGEKQRIAMARALLLRKNLYLLDEVTSALDAESKQAVLEVLADPEFTVLSVAHDTDWIERCDVVFELESGCLTKETRRGNP